MTIDRQLAGNRNLGSFLASQLWAGEAPIITDSAPALVPITQWQLCALTNTGITPFVAGTHVGQQAVISVIGVAAGAQCPYWNAGKFIADAVTWPATINTLPLQKALLIGSMLHVGHVNA